MTKTTKSTVGPVVYSGSDINTNLGDIYITKYDYAYLWTE